MDVAPLTTKPRKPIVTASQHSLRVAVDRLEAGKQPHVILRVANGKQITGSVEEVTKSPHGVRRVAVCLEYNGKTLIAEFLEPFLGVEESCRAEVRESQGFNPRQSDVLLFGFAPVKLEFDN